MDNSDNNINNYSTDNASCNSSSNNNNLISSINTNSTNIVDSNSVCLSSSSSSNSNQNNHVINNNNNEQNLLEHLIIQQQQQQQQHQQQLFNMNTNKLNTLARQHSILHHNHNHHHHQQHQHQHHMFDQYQTNRYLEVNQQPATHAYLVQTPNGSALLIPPQLQPVPIQPMQQTTLNTLNSRTINSTLYNNLNRPESTQSNTTNVYQTIDVIDSLKNNQNSYLYPLYNNTNSNVLNEQLKDAKLFASPTLSELSNRKNLTGSKLERFKYNLSKKLRFYFTWKCLSIMFIFIIMNLILFILYLGFINNNKSSLISNTNNKNMLSQSSLVKVSTLSTNYNSIFFSKIGDTIQDELKYLDLFKIQIYLDKSSFVKFNISFSRNSLLGFYANKDTQPSYTKYVLFERLDSINSQLKLQLTQDNLVSSSFVNYLEHGIWYISILNDNYLFKNRIKFRLKSEFYTDTKCSLLNNCNSNGECVNNTICKCYTGFTGSDCSTPDLACPILCSGHGKYENAKCLCDTDWHGKDCEIPKEQCLIADCNLNGQCMNGKCMCYPGYTGESCELKQCLPSPTCSSNGVCINGVCKCFSNYTGDDCSRIAQNRPCSDNGYFKQELNKCECSPNWTGADCSININCLNKECTKCKYGWTGSSCMFKDKNACDLKCSQNGICVNGTCNCSPGYHGRNCDLNSCPNGCSSNGICEKIGYTNKYQCLCNPGWTGKACEIQIEMVCNDDLDNDGDGLTDCADSECCVFDNCKLSLACQSSPEPKDRLLRKQPPSLSATFFDKMKFLIEDGSVQSFAYTNTFLESQVSVIRGQVVFKNGQALIGVKVNVLSNPSYGYTLTRSNGVFDLMVNGGGTILLEFSRNRLKTRVLSVNAICNQFVYIDQVEMYLQEDKLNLLQDDCKLKSAHYIDLYRPLIKSNWKEIRSFWNNEKIQLESGVIKESLSLLKEPNMELIHTSNQAQGFQSTISFLLTRSELPELLQQVHLKIIIEGVLFKQTFDAVPNLKFEYSWDKRNAYEQRVYGFTQARIQIGYEYESCSFIHWSYYQIKLNGYDLLTSEIGAWNLNIHHRLNTQQGILHKGDGHTIYLKELQKVLEVSFGVPKQKRSLDSTDLKLQSPNSLSINKDGVLFISDSDLVWMLNNTEAPKKVAKFNHDLKYYLTNEPVYGQLYVSDSINRNIYSLNSNEIKLSFNNIKFKYPKSIVFDKNLILYIIDSNQIKLINQDGLLLNTIGLADFKPDCKSIVYDLNSIKFYWPKSLAINPIDNSLFVLDEQAIFKLDLTQNKIELITGVPFGCPDNKKDRLFGAVDIAFNSDGDLYILENEMENNIKQIRVLKSTGELETYFDLSELNEPVSIAVHQNRSVYVLDRGDFVLYQIKNVLMRDDYTGKYSIVSAEANEAYIFNRFGLHLNTIDLKTGKYLYNFTYNGNALYGKLTSVSNQDKVLLSIKRDFHGRAESLQLNSNQLVRLKLNNFDLLKSLSFGSEMIQLNYLTNTGLLLSKIETENDSKKSTVFSYEKNGRLKELSDSANRMSRNLTYSINEFGSITVMNNDFWLFNSTGVYLNDLKLLNEKTDDDKLFKSVSNEEYLLKFRAMFLKQQFTSINKLRSDNLNKV